MDLNDPHFIALMCGDEKEFLLQILDIDILQWYKITCNSDCYTQTDKVTNKFLDELISICHQYPTDLDIVELLELVDNDIVRFKFIVAYLKELYQDYPRELN
jgi:hypothetical protein